jgi:hypothetical protein
VSTVVIGDVHGKFNAYKNIISKCDRSIQVGDLGVGFIDPRTEIFSADSPRYMMASRGHRFIRGNHDNPRACRHHSQWIEDGSVHGEVMFIGGALSIDRAYRTEGYDWWADEELSIAELNRVASTYAAVKPRVMITHECPESISDAIMASRHKTKFNMPSRTRQAFQAMFEFHQPDLWIHGHWHVSFDDVFDGTRFVCLAELEAKTFDF